MSKLIARALFTALWRDTDYDDGANRYYVSVDGVGNGQSAWFDTDEDAVVWFLDGR